MVNSIDLRGDCDRIPFRYAVHLAQHNERMIARMLGCSREQLTDISAYQRRRRFSTPVELGKPETWLYVCSPVAPRGLAGGLEGWRGALELVGSGVLVYDREREGYVIHSQT